MASFLETRPMGRRGFLTASTAAVAWTAKSYAQVAGANDRLRIGVIGCGGMAGVHMGILVKNREKDNTEILKVCDVYRPRLEKAAQLTGGKMERDYRRVLEDSDVDYVLIATPEHWHAKMILDALDADKHVYVEKPMTHQVDEAKKVIAKLKTKPKLKLQVGVQGMSDNSYASAYEYVKDGTLGKVVIAQIDYSRNHLDDYWAYPIDADAKPGPDLDWKAWLGPAPKRDWDPNRFFRWRWFWDYSGGIATDLFIHRATRLLKALNLTFPQYCVGTGGKWQFTQSKAEVPDTFNAQADYEGGPTMLLVSSMANSRAVEHVLRGHKATLTFTRTGFTITPEREYAKEVKPLDFKKTGAESVDPHHKNLQAAIRRNEALHCDAELGYRGMVVCKMAVESFRKRQYVKWDFERQQIRKA